ncbi:MAG: AraC family transcriptional regulator [Hespellia sp.]|nr:AraC family transcriptional regulator [Hespellia sp.]
MTYIKTKLTKEIDIDAIITIHYFEYMKDFVFKGESHDFWEFLYVDKGTVTVRSDDEWHTLNTGDIIFHKPNEFHAIRSIGKNPPNLVVASFVTRSPAIAFFENKIYTLGTKERAQISVIVEEARETFSTPIHIPSVEQVHFKSASPFASQQMILLYLELLLVTIVRNHSDQTSNQRSIRRNSPEKKFTKQSRITEIIQYMQFHICEHLTISDICEAFSISRSTLQSLFHEEKGCGTMDYFNRMKITRAKDIIRDGTMNFTEIAYFLSYTSLPYFSKQFKNATGMSPLEYSSSVKGMTEALKNSTYNQKKSLR